MRIEYRNPQTTIAIPSEATATVQGMVALPPPPAPSSGAWFRRFIIVSVVGAMIGAAIAAIAFLFQPPIYRTKVRVQIVDVAQLRGIGNSRADADYGSPLSDEVLVARSERVLRRAAIEGQLAATKEFVGNTPEQIAGRLIDDPALRIAPAFDDQATSVVLFQYDSGNPSTTQRVIGSIVNAYDEHTKEKFEQKDTDVMDQILLSRDEALTELQRLERLHDEFKMESDLVFVDGRPQSIHRKTADRFQSQKQELLVNRADIQSRLNAAQQSLDNGEAPTTVMLAMRAKTETASDVIDRTISEQLTQLQNELRDRASVRVEESELLPLQLEREARLTEYGASHPTVRAIDKKIAVVENRIKRLVEQEEKKEALIKKIMTINGQPVSDEEIDPQAEARKRVELAIEALKQQLDSTEQQIAAVSEAYDLELQLAKAEVADIRESNRFERDIARQTEVYNKIVTRLDEAKFSSGSEGLNVTPLDEAQPGRRVTRPIFAWVGVGSLIGWLVGAFLSILIAPRPTPVAPGVGQIVALPTTQPALGQVTLVPTLEITENQVESESPSAPERLE